LISRKVRKGAKLENASNLKLLNQRSDLNLLCFTQSSQRSKDAKRLKQKRKENENSNFLKRLNCKMHKLPSPFGEGLGMGFSNWNMLPNLPTF
jgi:hypothetical protein